MDFLLYFFASLLFFIGLIGCFLPVIPGPPLSYIGLVLIHFTSAGNFSKRFLWIWLAITLVVQALDYVVPSYGTKRFGGTKSGISGSIVGLILGVLFFPPFGIIVGPMVGAFVGEVVAGRTRQEAYRSAWGSFLGFLAGAMLKLIASIAMTYYALEAIFTYYL